MAYDDSLNIDARIDQSGVESGMNDMQENVRRGMDAVNNSFSSGIDWLKKLKEAAVVVGTVKVFSGMIKSGDEFNQAMNQLSASTGAVGEELEDLKEVSKDVFANNYGESYEDVANAVANVKKQLGDLSNDELQAITESAFALNDVFEYDVAESTRAAKAMVDNFGISGEYAMELIATGAQNGLDYSGELIDSISEYSVQFAKVGLDADDMFQIFQQGAENGAWNLDKVGDAVKEFSIRAIDGSDSTAEGFAAIGLNAEQMANEFAQGGNVAKQAFQETISALTSMEDPIARDAAGVALFGTMWEDLGVEAVASLGDISGNAYATGNALDTIKEVKYNDIGSAIEGLKRSVGSFTIDAKSAFSGEIAGAIGTLVNALNSADGDISVVFDGIVNAAKQAFSAFGGLVGGWAENGKKIIEYLIDGIQKSMPEIQEKAGEIISFLVSGFLNGRKKMLEVAVPITTGLVQGISQALPEILASGAEILQSLIQGISESLPQLISSGLVILHTIVNGIIGVIPQLLPLAITIITVLVNGLTQAIVAVLQFAPQILTTLISGIIAVLPTLIECAVQILNFLISAITANLPLILGAAIEILMALITGIIENITVIIGAALEILNALISAILENLPLIISAAVELLIALLNGIIENLPMLIDAAIQILMTLVDFLIQNLPMLIDAAIQIITQLVSGIIANLPQLLDAGVRLITELIAGLVKAIPDIIRAIPQIVSAIWDTLKETDWLQLGKDLLRGIADGLLAGLDAIWDTITEVGESIWNGFKDFFGIASPSKLMRDEVGKWLLPGVSVGVEDTSDKTANEINGSLKSMSNQFELPEISVEQPKISISEQEPPEFDIPEIETPEQAEIGVKQPKISISEQEPPEFDTPEIEVPEQAEISVKQPEISISEQEQPESSEQMFTQQIEILRKFSPENDVSKIDDSRITAEIQSQLDEIMVTLNADNFIARLESILANFGNNAVPQYSAVYSQVQSVPERREINSFELPKTTQNSQKFNIYIGDTEIKDFVISAIDEANAVSGGVSV